MEGSLKGLLLNCINAKKLRSSCYENKFNVSISKWTKVQEVNIIFQFKIWTVDDIQIVVE